MTIKVNDEQLQMLVHAVKRSLTEAKDMSIQRLAMRAMIGGSSIDY